MPARAHARCILIHLMMQRCRPHFTCRGIAAIAAAEAVFKLAKEVQAHVTVICGATTSAEGMDRASAAPLLD